MATIAALFGLGLGTGYYMGYKHIHDRFFTLLGVIEHVNDKGPVYNVISGVGVVAKSVIFKAKNFCESYANTYTEKVGKKTYDIHYCIRNKKYIHRTNIKNGPNPISNIINQSKEDVTQKILSYLGPNLDFHNYKFTPRDFNCKSITIFFNDGDNKTIEELEIIKL